MKNMLNEPYDMWRDELYYRPNKRMDRGDAQYLLVNIKKVAESNNIIVMPMFGTLLGAVREHNFIQGDNDIDVVIYAKDVQYMMNLKDALQEKGINLFCYCLPWVFTFEYKGITCDIYPLYESVWPWTNHYYLLLEKYISRSFFDATEDYKLFGETFKIPAHPENILAYLYGKTWRIPQSTKPKIESRLFFWRYAHRFIQKCIRYAKRHWFKTKN